MDRGCRCAEDCPERDAHEAAVNSANEYGKVVKGKYQVILTPEDADELRSDAYHYASSGVSVYGQELMGLVSSARATLKALDAGTPTFIEKCVEVFA